ncbi:MFS transporter [Sphaerimonospora sp. CA-214678]|uniref:MFS transporter n=1 Tax=Sphaerimonospora sp. CA-214678 TaxID=3240029 RepID=UPI003D936F42
MATLAVTQIVGHGVLYYAFAVLLTPMQTDLHASTAQLAGALTASVLVSALAAPLVGRWLDARGGRGLMTFGAALGAGMVLVWSQVTTLAQLYAVLVVVGIATAMVLYEAAFAIVVAWSAPARRAKALLAITVVAGFASSVFLPLTGLLVEELGWREALMVLGVAYGLLAVPLHALVLPRHAGPVSAPRARRGEAVRRALREWAFWMLAGAFVVQTGATAVVGVLLVTYLIALGHKPIFAAVVAGLLGVLSVTGRLISTALASRWSVASITASIFALQGAAALALPLAGRYPAGAVGAVTLFGLGFGVATIARPALLAERYGTTAYGSVSGALALPVIVAKACAPLLAATLVPAIGYSRVMAGVALACTLAGLVLAAYHRLLFRSGSN